MTRTRLVLVTAVLLLTACRSVDRTAGKGDNVSDVKIDGAHSTGLDATIPQGQLYSQSSSKASWIAEIRDQLNFSVGQLNGRQGVGDMNRLDISIDESLVTMQPNGWRLVPYAAKFLVAWPRENPFPDKYPLYVPRGGDLASRIAFFNAYKDKCVDAGAHDVQLGTYWYYYRPQPPACPMSTGVYDAGLTVRLSMDLVTSALNTEGKAPEYAKVWEDNRLVVTAIFGQAEAGTATATDAGVMAFNEAYNKLRLTYGTPKHQVPPGAEDAAIAPTSRDLHMKWDIASKGELDVRMLLVERLQPTPDPGFRAVYDQRTRDSDLITYSGHSGLGANIRALAGMGQFVAGQYQLFLINGCDTFAYVDNALRDLHAQLNPGQPPSLYFDIITNAMPSYFSMNSRSNVTLIQALAGATKTYRQLLEDFDRNQRAVVTGEEDNLWPQPFP